MATRDASDPPSPASAAGPAAAAPAGKTRSRWPVHLLTFAVTVLLVWGGGAYAGIYFFPLVAYNRVANEVVNHGLGGAGSTGIPLNTLYTQPTLASPTQANSLESTENHDTLYTVGVLDLSKGPEVLHVPDMAGRYYVVQFTDPWGTDFAYVGRRTTGTAAGDYLISGPGWQGTIPAGVKQIAAPDNTVLVIGRTLVTSDSDLAPAYGLATQIQVTPLSQGPPDR
jgi:hypothetical protein